MDKILEIFKVDMKMLIRNISFKEKGQEYENRDILRLIIIVVSIASLIPLYGMLFKNLYYAYDIFKYLDQEIVFMQFGIIINQFVMLILGVPYVLGKYYFSKDIEYLVPLPIESYEIIGGKFLSLMAQEYIISLPLILPFIVTQGIKSTGGITYIIKSIILVLTLPILPLTLLSALVMLLMKFTNIGSRKNTLRVLGSIILVVLLLYVQVKIQSIVSISIESGIGIEGMMEEYSRVFSNYGKFYPPSIWGAKFLLGKSLTIKMINGLYYFGLSLVSYLVMLKIADLTFFEGLIGGGEISSKDKNKFKKSRASSKFKKKPMWYSLAKKELIMIVKTPIYLVNTIMGIFMMPIIIGISFKMSGDMDYGILLNSIKQMYPQNQGVFMLIILGIIMFFNLLNTTSSTSYSREGKSMWIQKTLPIDGRTQSLARILASLTIQMIAIIMVVVIARFILKISILQMIFLIVMGVAGSIPIIETLIYIDLSRPSLNWKSPQEAMKQNFNVLIGMGISILYLGLISLLTVFLIGRNISYGLIYVILFVISLIISIFMFRILADKTEEKLMDLE